MRCFGEEEGGWDEVLWEGGWDEVLSGRGRRMG